MAEPASPRQSWGTPRVTTGCWPAAQRLQRVRAWRTGSSCVVSSAVQHCHTFKTQTDAGCRCQTNVRCQFEMPVCGCADPIPWLYRVPKASSLPVPALNLLEMPTACRAWSQLLAVDPSCGPSCLPIDARCVHMPDADASVSMPACRYKVPIAVPGARLPVSTLAHEVRVTVCCPR